MKELSKALLVSLWFMFLTFPILVIRVNTVENTVEWRWRNMLMVGAAAFALHIVWGRMLARGQRRQTGAGRKTPGGIAPGHRLSRFRRFGPAGILLLTAGLAALPFFSSLYQVNILITAMIYIMLGLGLNIVVGLAGLLNLGYVAFYAVGAYSYALLHLHYGLNFWLALPLGASLAALAGIALGYPVLRLRGDYLAIVTLAFGEIIRLVLENWSGFSFGPSGIADIPRPPLFGISMSLEASTVFFYFLMLLMVTLTVFVVTRLQHSRIGRAWVALREDEIACQAMGIDTTRIKLAAFALGATWAGLGGVLFASRTTFINPACFTIWESMLILCIVVLGGMGSIIGVVVGALFLILLPEYLRAFSEYRVLLFGLLLVLMMIFRPGGLLPDRRRTYHFKGETG
ncbi:MAG: branched-chain amino acid ABC transporter permease [Thermodesulfobacteriota bacterium]